MSSDSDSCSTAVGDYNLGLHVASVFVMVISSGLGVFTPVIFGHSRFGSIFFVLKYFGSGIIISLAFCHLLQDSFENFDSECIGELAYEPTAPAIAMAAALLIWLVDFFGARQIARQAEVQPASPDMLASPDAADDKPLDVCGDCRPVEIVDPSSRQAHFSVQILEGGIVFHSVMIGVALGAQTDGFNTTFAALVFHQLFEGLGLGSRISLLTFNGRALRWAMCMAYTLVTPIGIAIGIGVHQSFNNTGRAELLAIGILNAISAGILLYSGLGQLLYAEWVVGDMRHASGRRITAALVALGLGLFAMSLIGEWT